MSGGNGNDHANGATTSSRSGATRSRSSSGRPDKPTDLPPLRSFRDRLPWLPWALVGLLGVLVLVLVLNALDFSRREQLLERRLEIAVEDQEGVQETVDAEGDEPAPTSTSIVPLTPPGNAASIARERELQDQAAELRQRSDELDQREAELDAREQALSTTVPASTEDGAPSFSTGVFLVGVDIPTGIYRTDAPEGCRYTKVASNGAVIDSDLRLNAGPVSLEIDENVHRIDSDGCGTWVRVG